ncbi:serine/threonine protein kinase [Paenibacillus validus]|uniref:serine/threonine protein kinase n=1 Tax=Paenibacillus validus TaxID=44253 RepID=UPI0018C30653|nr:serine/threonine-protein kinase [Paenibacillus validus]
MTYPSLKLDTSALPDLQRDEFFFLKPLQLVTSEDSRYRCLSFVGKGGNGATFKVVCEKGKYEGIEFALKVFYRVSDLERRRRFLREAGMLASLSHPSIIRLFDRGVYKTRRNSYPFMIVEFIPSSIRDLLSMSGGALAPLRAIRCGLQILNALNYIHTLASPIVHRDIKPENILVANDFVKLADFGLFREILSESTDRVVGPTTGPAMPVRYRTPDLIQAAIDGTPPTTASDIYQVGLVLYEMCTGWNPQKQVLPKDILSPIEISPLRISWTKGDEIVQLISEMLSPEPSMRPTASECISRLMEIYLFLQKSHVDLFNTTA